MSSQTANSFDVVAFSALIVNIIASIFFPLFQKPILEYAITQQPSWYKDGIEIFAMDIGNDGFAAANHVIVSISGVNITFCSFASHPFLGKHFSVNNTVINGTTNGHFEIDVIPPQMHVRIVGEIDVRKSDPYQNLNAIVWSDEIVGYDSFTLDEIIVSYIAFAILAPLLFVNVFRRW